MQVTKRNGHTQPVSFDKITRRLEHLSGGLQVDPVVVAKYTIQALCDKITTQQLDIIAANYAESMGFLHSDYGVLAGRLAINNNHKSTPASFSQCCELQRANGWFLDEQALAFVRSNATELDAMIVHARDNDFSFASYKTLQQSYLRTNEPPPWAKTIENAKYYVIDRPQYIFMRNAIAKWMGLDRAAALQAIKEDYDALSMHLFIHGTPTLINACESGTLVSCYLFGCKDDTRAIGEFQTRLMLLSKSGGGVGGFFHDIRSAGSRIKTSRGVSSGLCPQLLNHMGLLKTFDQGGGKRKGSGAVYIELWHADVLGVFQMKRSSGGAYRGRDLFYAAWVPDLFMRRLIKGQPWTLMSSDTAPGLAHVYDGMEVCSACGFCANPAYAKWIEPPFGQCADAHTWKTVDAFTELYTKYEQQGLGRGQISPLLLCKHINETRRETGVPYICFKDHVNRQTNQKNIGTIQSSNLCTEIMQWSTDDSVATCILASINLTKCITLQDGRYQVDCAAIERATRRAVRDCDRMVDINKYPIAECRYNAEATRAIGVGCQGMANLFAILRIGWDSEEAEQIDMMIHETMYYAALSESCDLAEQNGPYPLFWGSPASRGQLRFDLWADNQRYMAAAGYGSISSPPLSGKYNFDALRQRIMTVGLRNSLLLALMPTQSTSLILGNNECFEPFFTMCFSRSVLGGERPEFNRHLAQHCTELGIWTDQLRADLVAANGVTSKVSSLPSELKAIYKVWCDIPQRTMIARAAKRAAFIDQSQSLNLLFTNNADKYLNSALVDAWTAGLPTGCYYTRTAAVTEALATTSSTLIEASARKPEAPSTGATEAPVCKLEDGCTYCSS